MFPNFQGLPDLGEIYPLGGSADRLGLVDPATGECLPAAMLSYCGRTLLEGLIRDLQVCRINIKTRNFISGCWLKKRWFKHNCPEGSKHISGYFIDGTFYSSRLENSCTSSCIINNASLLSQLWQAARRKIMNTLLVFVKDSDGLDGENQISDSSNRF